MVMVMVIVMVKVHKQVKLNIQHSMSETQKEGPGDIILKAPISASSGKNEVGKNLTKKTKCSDQLLFSGQFHQTWSQVKNLRKNQVF